MYKNRSIGQVKRAAPKVEVQLESLESRLKRERKEIARERRGDFFAAVGRFSRALPYNIGMSEHEPKPQITAADRQANISLGIRVTGAALLTAAGVTVLALTGSSAQEASCETFPMEDFGPTPAEAATAVDYSAQTESIGYDHALEQFSSNGALTVCNPDQIDGVRTLTQQLGGN